MKFEVIQSPYESLDPVLSAVISGKDPGGVIEHLSVNISPPTDDNPFFFFMLHPKDMLSSRLWSLNNLSDDSKGIPCNNIKSVIILFFLLAVVMIMAFFCIIIPLLFTIKKTSLKGSLLFFLFFGFTGPGFMFIELSQIHRLIIFLGHPVYGLSVVLFAFLLFSAIGSYSTEFINSVNLKKYGILRFIILLSVLILFGKITPWIINIFHGYFLPVRIVVSLILLFPICFFMGMVFPIGIKMSSLKFKPLIPWFWGINGLASICASVLEVIIAMAFDISTAFRFGVICYVFVFIVFIVIVRDRRNHFA